jgi:uncharacterized protein (TIGR00251 family)
VDDPSAPGWARPTADGWQVRLRIQPGARRSEVVGPHGDQLKVRVSAPPDDGRANAALISFLASRLGVPPRGITIVRGRHHRDKVIDIVGSVDPSVLTSG